MALLYPSLAFFSVRIVVQRGLGRFGIGRMEGMQKFTRMNALPSGGLDVGTFEGDIWGHPNPHKAELKIVNCKLESANLRKTAVQKQPFHPLFKILYALIENIQTILRSF